MIDQCYMCQARATGREHVPPKSFFPEKKDLPTGVDLRKDLISVPSCDVHNIKKSKDDEYLAFVIVMHYENNSIAATHFLTKVLRALKRRPSLRGFFETQRDVMLNGAPATAIKLDYPRIERCLTYMAKALYFETYREQWLVPVGIHISAALAFDHSQGRVLHQTKQIMRSLVSHHFAQEPRLGKNQKVFWYQPWRDTQRGITLINMCFYDGVSVIALSHPKVNTHVR